MKNVNIVWKHPMIINVQLGFQPKTHFLKKSLKIPNG